MPKDAMFILHRLWPVDSNRNVLTDQPISDTKKIEDIVTMVCARTSEEEKPIRPQSPPAPPQPQQQSSTWPLEYYLHYHFIDEKWPKNPMFTVPGLWPVDYNGNGLTDDQPVSLDIKTMFTQISSIICDQTDRKPKPSSTKEASCHLPPTTIPSLRSPKAFVFRRRRLQFAAVYLYASDNNIARGGPEFLSFAKLKDPKQGFLLDDTLINEAEATLLGLVLRINLFLEVRLLIMMIVGTGLRIIFLCFRGLLRTAVVLGILRRKVWVAPQMGAFKINVDAAMRLGNGRYGSMVQVR
ncbi:hypothetical protein LWI29_022922 [Acer saccharum]|uniref:Uncharacterized protein n=1 Tax=Acer saccharum TaxID=4024 RepID=A0AA39VW16_ACESA|nr:hypothetical protein LWI29_022922 [Acer saccharum]